MHPPIFPICAADPAVQAQLGTLPTRLYAWAEAPQEGATPYAVWQVITGAPENHLGDAPDVDRFTVQVDAYARTGAEVLALAEALRDAIEPHAYIVRWGDQTTDPDTGLRRYSFDVSWHVLR
ncbi:Protein of unknown function [Halomonas shengliensis]|uniref:DUF3168 domain-containing protein n=1 Tax=Halomonas shengliensis TaxID=419597 RepID=A0A1H0LY30_9GAMM|nr:DUF3168 domain-containing protein [Halomonas shengliensis]SDO72830.1 Protein of unknown function [Halomonas shengliensis]